MSSTSLHPCGRRKRASPARSVSDSLAHFRPRPPLHRAGREATLSYSVRASQAKAEFCRFCIDPDRRAQVARRHDDSGAVQWRERPSCRAARKILRFAGNCNSLAEIACNAEQFRREHHEALRAAREQDLRSQAREIDLDDIHSVLAIRTSSDLESVGKTLHNCLANRAGSHYHDQLKTGVAEFWAIRRVGTIIGVLSIRTDTRELDGCLGDRNEPVSADRSTMLSIRHTVDGTLGPGECKVSLFNRLVGA